MHLIITDTCPLFTVTVITVIICITVIQLFNYYITTECESTIAMCTYPTTRAKKVKQKHVTSSNI